MGGLHQQWQADLVDVSNLKKDNDGITFLLTVIDVFSQWACCISLKNKSASLLVAAFTELLSNIKPVTLQTDKGLEFLNRSFQALLKENGVYHFSTHNEETKASIVERFNRTLKTRMWRYFTKHQTVRYLEKLRDFVWPYNNTYHRSLGMAPSMLNEMNQEAVWQRLYGRDGGGKPKFVVGDHVRISKTKRQFKKGTWLTGPKNCSLSPPVIALTHPYTDWLTTTESYWTGRSTNRNYRKFRYQTTNFIALKLFCGEEK